MRRILALGFAGLLGLSALGSAQDPVPLYPEKAHGILIELKTAPAAKK